MKSIFFMLGLLLATAQLTTAQNIITGSVQDDKGTPLHYAFIEDSQYKNAALSDSLGNFSITAHPDSKLEVAMPGYKDTLINAVKDGMRVVLRPDGAGTSGNQGSLSAKIETQNSNSNDMATIGQGGVIAPSHQKGNLRGNQYFLNAFAHGFLINSAGELVYNSGYLYDYDKVGGGLLMTKDLKSINEISWDQTKSFTLYNSAGEHFTFEKVPAIDPTHYVQVLASGLKYKIYKLIKTRFVKADYVNNGVTSHGNDYDEFVDDADYYVVDVQNNQQLKLSLKKKSIKENFANEAAKVNKYLSDNGGSINDAYLSKLGAYMNQ